MSDTPPDRDEASAAPEGPRNPWVGWLVWAILVPVLYVLSAGPVQWLVLKEYIPGETAVIYLPLVCLPDSIGELIQRYLQWWRP